MNKFIEITENGKRILINLGCVIKLRTIENSVSYISLMEHRH